MNCPRYGPKPVDNHWIFYGAPKKNCGSCSWYNGKCEYEKELMEGWSTVKKNGMTSTASKRG